MKYTVTVQECGIRASFSVQAADIYETITAVGLKGYTPDNIVKIEKIKD